MSDTIDITVRTDSRWYLWQIQRRGRLNGSNASISIMTVNRISRQFQYLTVDAITDQPLNTGQIFGPCECDLYESLGKILTRLIGKHVTVLHVTPNNSR